MSQPALLDQFRRALAGAARAIAKDPEVEVVFASEVAPPSGKTARVVLPGPAFEPRLVAEARGAADALALRLRHHDAKLHASHVPMDLKRVPVRRDRDGEGRGSARDRWGVRGQPAELTEAASARSTPARSCRRRALATAVGRTPASGCAEEHRPRASAGVKLSPVDG